MNHHTNTVNLTSAQNGPKVEVVTKNSNHAVIATNEDVIVVAPALVVEAAVEHK